MESLPARQPAQRRSSPPEAAQHPATSPIRARSEDSQSQTIFQHESPEETESHQDQDQQQHEQPQSVAPPQTEEENVPKCWICLLDATEDTPDSTPWRSPCPCALTAHEACLLDWIADIEAPSKHPTSKPQIQCPQCKSEIRLDRPRDLVVDLFKAVERVGAKAATRTALLALGGMIYGACAAGGVHTIYAVFGPDDGGRILAPVLENAVRAPVDAFVGTPREAVERVWDVVMDHVVHWRLYLGLPLITPTLVLSRTSLADGVLPILPVLFFVTQTGRIGEGEIMQWPPSAEFAFAVLPYVRGLYNAYYKRVWEARKKKWEQELRPRTVQQTEGEDGGALPAGDGQAGGGGGFQDEVNVIEVQVDGGIFDDWEIQDDDEEEELQREEVRPNIIPQLQPFPQAQQEANAAEAAPPPQIPDNRQAAANGNARNDPIRDRNELLRFSATGIASTVLGALLFPTLSGLAGEALKLVLPRNWLFGNGGRKTFLQAKWARSLVGGCLLVLGKDALVIYVKWKMAKMQRSRRVVNYVRKEKA